MLGGADRASRHAWRTGAFAVVAGADCAGIGGRAGCDGSMVCGARPGGSRRKHTHAPSDPCWSSPQARYPDTIIYRLTASQTNVGWPLGRFNCARTFWSTLGIRRPRDKPLARRRWRESSQHRLRAMWPNRPRLRAAGQARWSHQATQSERGSVCCGKYAGKDEYN